MPETVDGGGPYFGAGVEGGGGGGGVPHYGSLLLPPPPHPTGPLVLHRQKLLTGELMRNEPHPFAQGLLLPADLGAGGEDRLKARFHLWLESLAASEDGEGNEELEEGD